MRGVRDVADFTSDLVEWAAELLPELKVKAACQRSAAESEDGGDCLLIKLATIEGLNGARSRDAVGQRLKLEYHFDLLMEDPLAEHQAIADLAFGLLDRSDIAEGEEAVHGDGPSVRACFFIERRRDLPRAKPVREAVIQLHPQATVAGLVQAENGFPLAGARLHVRDSGRLVVADNDGAFAFAAPEGTIVRATVTAKGRTTDVELKPGDPNVITLAMET